MSGNENSSSISSTPRYYSMKGTSVATSDSSADSSPPLHDRALGTSFKPLQLSSHPWVRAHFRQTSKDGQKPRLSFLALHYHMNGRDSFSESVATSRTPGRGARSRNSPEALSEALGTTPGIGASYVAGPHTGVFSRTTPPKSSGYFSCRRSETLTSPPMEHLLQPPTGSRSHSEVGSTAPSPPRSDTLRTVSAPDIVGPPRIMARPTSSTDQAPDHSSRRRRVRENQSSAPPLAMAAFPTAFTDIFTTSESLFGCAREQANQEHFDDITSQKDALGCVKDKRQKGQGASDHGATK